MSSTLFNLNEIKNIDDIVLSQRKRFNDILSLLDDLQFIPVDSSGGYTPISYKSVDGGMLGIRFDPFALDLIQIADSQENYRMRFLIPKHEDLQKEEFAFLNEFPEVQQFTKLIGASSILDCVEFLASSDQAMELAEYCCIFSKLIENNSDPLLIIKDGLLRTKIFPYRIKKRIFDILCTTPKRKLIGVAKYSQILNLLSSALKIRHIIPSDFTGFIKIPINVELKAYHWIENIKDYTFGDLYLAKLAKRSNLLVTVEIPFDRHNQREIYSERDIREIFGHLVRDARTSFPIIGYPQTIMRAHEKAVQTGLVASIWQEKIIDHILSTNAELRYMLSEANYLRDYVQKSTLGGI